MMIGASTNTGILLKMCLRGSNILGLLNAVMTNCNYILLGPYPWHTLFFGCLSKMITAHILFQKKVTPTIRLAIC